MSKLDAQQANILRLIMRSKAGDDGWYRVSKLVWPLVDGVLPPDLVETRSCDVPGGGYVRLTERGQAVADYF